MRLYSFGNMYLQGVQAGIQCQHCTTRMFIKYLDRSSSARGYLLNWANEHETTILLNGGMQEQLQEIKAHLALPENPYPWDYFNESEEALAGALTNVSVVLPEKVYMYKKWSEEIHTEIQDRGTVLELYREEDNGEYSPHFQVVKYTKWELKLIEIINSKRLMS